MTAKLILSILFLLLILEIFPKKSEAIANGPGQACKGNQSKLCRKTGLMKDDKVHIHNTIHVLGDLSLIVNRCCSRIFKLKTDKRAIFRLRKFFPLQYSCWETEQNFQDLPIEASVTTFVLMVDIFRLP